eukprot:601146_1
MNTQIVCNLSLILAMEIVRTIALWIAVVWIAHDNHLLYSFGDPHVLSVDTDSQTNNPLSTETDYVRPDAFQQHWCDSPLLLTMNSHGSSSNIYPKQQHYGYAQWIICNGVYWIS